MNSSHVILTKWLVTGSSMYGLYRSHAGWKAAMNQFAVLYEDRFTRNHL